MKLPAQLLTLLTLGVASPQLLGCADTDDGADIQRRQQNSTAATPTEAQVDDSEQTPVADAGAPKRVSADAAVAAEPDEEVVDEDLGSCPGCGLG